MTCARNSSLTAVIDLQKREAVVGRGKHVARPPDRPGRGGSERVLRSVRPDRSTLQYRVPIPGCDAVARNRRYSIRGAVVVR